MLLSGSVLTVWWQIWSMRTAIAVDYSHAPLRRNVTTEDVGNAAAFLLSDLAAAITGEILYVDSGFSHVMAGNLPGLGGPKPLGVLQGFDGLAQVERFHGSVLEKPPPPLQEFTVIQLHVCTSIW